ncbi:GapR family DNA-binding domain-containing protein, partial [Tistrella sp.]
MTNTITPAAKAGGIAGDVLRSYIERIERLEEEKAGIAANIREI